MLGALQEGGNVDAYSALTRHADFRVRAMLILEVYFAAIAALRLEILEH
jgi:hypothetical protein